MVEQKVVTVGCSYSEEAWPSNSDKINGTKPKNYSDFLNDIDGINCKNLSKSGNSNDASIRQLYYYVKKNNPKDTTFIFQITMLHRHGGFYSFNNKWLNFQPGNIRIENKKDIYKIGYKRFIYDELGGVRAPLVSDYDFDSLTYSDLNNHLKTNDVEMQQMLIFYNSFILKYKYDDILEFKELLFKIDLIKSFVNKNNNKLLLIFWPKVFPEYIDSLKEYDFFNIDGEYSMLKWSLDNKLIGEDTHLESDGHYKLSKKILEKIKYK